MQTRSSPWQLLLVIGQGVALVTALPRVIRSHSPSKGHINLQTSAAVVELSARGEGIISQGVQKRAPVCDKACKGYADSGVDMDTNPVCLDSELETCSTPTVRCGNVCDQKFEPDCSDFCSEWLGGVDGTALNVCQSVSEPWKCHKSCDGDRAVGSEWVWCRQKKIPECEATCDGYMGFDIKLNKDVDRDTEVVCHVFGAKTKDMPTQLSSDYYGKCMATPCMSSSSGPQHYAMICRQVFEICPHVCPGGTPKNNRTDEVTCYDSYAGKCRNKAFCTGGDETRCQERQSENSGVPDYEPDSYASNGR